MACAKGHDAHKVSYPPQTATIESAIFSPESGALTVTATSVPAATPCTWSATGRRRGWWPE